MNARTDDILSGIAELSQIQHGTHPLTFHMELFYGAIVDGLKACGDAEDVECTKFVIPASDTPMAVAEFTSKINGRKYEVTLTPLEDKS